MTGASITLADGYRGAADHGTDLAGAAGGGRLAWEGLLSSPAHRSRRAARPCTASVAPSSPLHLRTPRRWPRTLLCCERENGKIIMAKMKIHTCYISTQKKKIPKHSSWNQTPPFFFSNKVGKIHNSNNKTASSSPLGMQWQHEVSWWGGNVVFKSKRQGAREPLKPTVDNSSPHASRLDGGEVPPLHPLKAKVSSPQGPSLGKGGKEMAFYRTQALLCPASSQWQWQVSAFLHWLNWKEAIENSFDFQWQLLVAGHWRAKQANRKHLQTQTYFFPHHFFLLFLWKNNMHMRAWKREPRICRCPATFPNTHAFGEAKQRWWRGGGAPLVLHKTAAYVRSAEISFREWIHKPRPRAMHQGEMVGKSISRREGSEKTLAWPFST